MAFGPQTVQSFGGAVNDLFGYKAHKLRGQGQRLEAQMYDRSAEFARQNKLFTKASTDIKLAQENRTFLKTIGGQEAEIASAGFADSGSALDILRESMTQGALTRGALQMQGNIEEMSYEQQAESFDMMGRAARLSARASDIAATGSLISSGVKAVTGVATLFT